MPANHKPAVLAATRRPFLGINQLCLAAWLETQNPRSDTIVLVLTTQASLHYCEGHTSLLTNFPPAITLSLL